MKDLISAVTLLIGALGLLTQNALPPWIIILVALSLVVVAIALVYNPFALFFSRTVGKWRMRRLARTSFSGVLDTAKTFQQLIAPQNTNTLLKVFDLGAFYDQQAGKSLLPDAEHIETIRNWLSAIEKRAERRKLGDFPTLCAELSSLIHQYNRFLCQRLRQLEQFIATGSLDGNRLRELKQRWNVNRDSHVAFTREWEALAKAINEKSGRKLCVDYYEALGTLE